MKFFSEIDLSSAQHDAITVLRNQSFPEHTVARSYFKQLPHMRALAYQGEQLVGHMGLDYRAISVGENIHKALGIIDFCVDSACRGQGIGTSMLSQLSDYASTRAVDFIILISEQHDFYTAQGFQRIEALNAWLRLHEHKNYGVALEPVDELYIKPISGKTWGDGDVDWLGYRY